MTVKYLDKIHIQQERLKYDPKLFIITDNYHICTDLREAFNSCNRQFQIIDQDKSINTMDLRNIIDVPTLFDILTEYAPVRIITKSTSKSSIQSESFVINYNGKQIECFFDYYFLFGDRLKVKHNSILKYRHKKMIFKAKLFSFDPKVQPITREALLRQKCDLNNTDRVYLGFEFERRDLTDKELLTRTSIDEFWQTVRYNTRARFE